MGDLHEAEEYFDIPDVESLSLSEKGGSNELLEEEKVWVQALDAARREAGIAAPNKFMLASFAIQAKGDLKKALKRMGNFNNAVEQYRLNEISTEDATAWAKVVFPKVYYSAGENKNGIFMYGARGTERDTSNVKTEEDWRLVMKNVLLNLQAACPTLSDVRKGCGLILSMKGLSVSQYDRSFEKTTSQLTNNSYPTKVKEIYLVDAPSWVGMLISAAKLVVPAKVLRRIKNMSEAELPQHIEPSQLPPDLGGSATEDWFTLRDRRLQLHSKAVVELEGALG
mmetsp:Transcript_18879/g.38436  ORF Transcript_18879/g.38436 Transcript_18879/m.38436 type:complete len:282 (-) Transcript_18879:11-856(-)